MSYTNNPATNPIDALRLEVGDIDSEYPLLDDSAYSYYITKFPSNFRQQWMAAAQAILFTLSRWTRERTGQIEVYGSEAYKQYADALQMKLKNPSLNGVNPVCYFGGVEVTDKLENFTNPDITDQPHYRGQSDGMVDSFFKRKLYTDGTVEEQTEYPLTKDRFEIDE